MDWHTGPTGAARRSGRTLDVGLVRGMRSRAHGRSLVVSVDEGDDVHILRRSPNHHRNSLAERLSAVGHGSVPASAAEKGQVGKNRDERPCPRRTRIPAQMRSVEGPAEMNSVEVLVGEDLPLVSGAGLVIPGRHRLRGSRPCRLLRRICWTL